MQILPFADAEVVEELALAGAAELVAGQFLSFLLKVAPQCEVAHEVGPWHDEPLVRGVGSLAMIAGPLTDVGNRQCGGNDQNVGETTGFVCGDQHARDPRLDRDARHRASDRCQSRCGVGLVGRRDRTELGENSDAVADSARVGRLDEGEVGDVAEPQRRHLQDDRGEVGAEDLGVGEGGAGVEVGLAVQADADAGGNSPAPPGALAGARLRDRFDRKSMDLGARRVSRDACGARVDDVADARDGQRCLGDVGGQHDSIAT